MFWCFFFNGFPPPTPQISLTFLERRQKGEESLWYSRGTADGEAEYKDRTTPTKEHLARLEQTYKTKCLKARKGTLYTETYTVNGRCH